MQQLNDVWTDRKQCYRTHSTMYTQKVKTFNKLFCHAALGNNKDSQRPSCCSQTWGNKEPAESQDMQRQGCCTQTWGNKEPAESQDMQRQGCCRQT